MRLFITNRLPQEGLRSTLGRRFTFDLDNNAPSNSVFYCERSADGACFEIGAQAFMSRLKQTEYRQILIYIHGFSNLPEAVFSAADELQLLCDQKKDKEVLVVSMIWPCDNDFGIIKDYWDDQKSADASAFSFARVLEKFMAWRNESELSTPDEPCMKRINILAHSMGNRVLRESLRQWNEDLSSGVPMLFRNTFLVAADIVNESLERSSPGVLISHASRNVVVYHASDDLALRASKAANLKNKVASRRLGHTGPENFDVVPANVFAVDCDDVNNTYDAPKGHSYFRSNGTAGQPGLVFEHIFSALETGRVFPGNPTQRQAIIEAP